MANISYDHGTCQHFSGVSATVVEVHCPNLLSREFRSSAWPSNIFHKLLLQGFWCKECLQDLAQRRNGRTTCKAHRSACKSIRMALQKVLQTSSNKCLQASLVLWAHSYSLQIYICLEYCTWETMLRDPPTRGMSCGDFSGDSLPYIHMNSP